MKRGKDLICVICEHESDGLHFGQATCRACAAFFRRTVSQKLQYSCKRGGECEIDKEARNLCRYCRYQKCLAQGMLTSAVQNTNTSSSGSANLPHLLNQSQFPTLETANSNPLHGLPSFTMDSTSQQQMTLEHQLSTSSSSPSASTGQPEYKHLSRLWEGYHQFVALRKAGYAMLHDLDLQQLTDDEMPRSHIDKCKSVCKIVASLQFDLVDRYFWPFDQLPKEEKLILFHPFMLLSCNTERAFRTSKLYGPGDDRLIMPDGGYVRLSELHLFFKDSKKVTGDPEQVARIYHNALQYLLTTVVSYIRNIDMQPMELMAICGIYFWTESPDVSAETNQTIFQVRNEFIVDLHRYYRSTGLTEEDITLRTANLLLLVPKVETLVKMMLEDVSIAEIFNMLTIEETYKGHILV